MCYYVLILKFLPGHYKGGGTWKSVCEYWNTGWPAGENKNVYSKM